MIKKIIASMLFISLLFAISLSLLGVHQVELGKPFMAFMYRCSIELEDYKIAIPDIPSIPKADILVAQDLAWYEQVLNFFVYVWNAIVAFLNVVVVVLNFVILVLNTIIQLIEFTFIVLKNLIVFRDTLVNA